MGADCARAWQTVAAHGAAIIFRQSDSPVCDVIFCSEFCRVVLDLAFIQIRQFTRPRHLRFRPFAELAQVQESRGSGGEARGGGGMGAKLALRSSLCRRCRPGRRHRPRTGEKKLQDVSDGAISAYRNTLKEELLRGAESPEPHASRLIAVPEPLCAAPPHLHRRQ